MLYAMELYCRANSHKTLVLSYIPIGKFYHVYIDITGWNCCFFIINLIQYYFKIGYKMGHLPIGTSIYSSNSIGSTFLTKFNE